MENMTIANRSLRFQNEKEKPDNSIVLHILNKICIAKCMTKYIANKRQMYYTKRKTE